MYVDLKVGFAPSIKIRLMINMYAQTTLQSRKTLITLFVDIQCCHHESWQGFDRVHDT